MVEPLAPKGLEAAKAEGYALGVHEGRVELILRAFLAAAQPAPDARSPWQALSRDDLGRLVREAWIKWAKTQPSPKPSWLLSYDELSEADKEADRQIGEALSVALATPVPAAPGAGEPNVVAWQPHSAGHTYVDDGDDFSVVAVAERDYDNLVTLLPTRRRAVDYLIGVASRVATPSPATGEQ